MKEHGALEADLTVTKLSDDNFMVVSLTPWCGKLTHG
jgi:glycine cleavage system aminomethyltransferase T